MVERIAILGGGPAALTAAFEITSQPNWKNRYEVCIYTLGWRLGGKCASSRNDDIRKRNEEHGLHVLGGFYHNTFQILERLYKEWNGPVAFGQAFIEHNSYTVFEDRGNGKWGRVEITFPRYRALRPGQKPSKLNFVSLARRLINFILGGWNDAKSHIQTLQALSTEPGGMEEAENAFARLHGYGQQAEKYFADKADPSLTDPVIDVLTNIQTFSGAWEPFEVAESAFGSKGGSVRGADWGVIINMVVSVLKGLLRDRIVSRGFDSVNGEDALEWLARHGASQRTINSCYLQSGYHYAFAYEDGDPQRKNFAAGVALRGFLRMFLTYHGSVFYHMNGGMGEIFVTPFYDVLRKRGVKFAFFHRILEIAPAGDQIDRIIGTRQAAVKGDIFGYEPIRQWKDRRYWPASPDCEQLENCEAPEQTPRSDGDFSSGSEERFELERGTHFDRVILALPPGVLRTAARPLAQASQRWRNFLDSIKTTPTLAAQLWFGRDHPTLGAPKHGLMTCYALPHSTWSDMTFHAEFELPSSPQVNAITYLCGPCPATSDPVRATRDWFRTYGAELLPNLSQADEIDFYARCNLDAPSLYGLSGKGTIQYRPGAADLDFKNLILAGDWTKNGMDIGAVEAAVLSGRLAARALRGAKTPNFPGETDFG